MEILLGVLLLFIVCLSYYTAQIGLEFTLNLLRYPVYAETAGMNHSGFDRDGTASAELFG